MKDKQIASDRIISVFDQTFKDSHKTQLVGGATEPLYIPQSDHAEAGRSDNSGYHTIYFREDFASSALHEIAHWCLAGAGRRLLVDFGYWYEPVRDKKMQRQFEELEARPQAVEWILSIAAGIRFNVSADSPELPSLEFKQAIKSEADQLINAGLPSRAKKFADALSSPAINYTSSFHYQRLPD